MSFALNLNTAKIYDGINGSFSLYYANFGTAKTTRYKVNACFMSGGNGVTCVNKSILLYIFCVNIIELFTPIAECLECPMYSTKLVKNYCFRLRKTTKLVILVTDISQILHDSIV